MADEDHQEARRLRGALEHARFCRELADRAPDGKLRHAILRTASICEEFALRLEQPSVVNEQKPECALQAKTNIDGW